MGLMDWNPLASSADEQETETEGEPESAAGENIGGTGEGDTYCYSCWETFDGGGACTHCGSSETAKILRTIEV